MNMLREKESGLFEASERGVSGHTRLLKSGVAALPDDSNEVLGYSRVAHCRKCQREYPGS